ncbi:hypothetical protein VCR6J2_470089 [Vibrio coralliirubri]|nr:hypothetical protein VCR6J2_470089 [Vibrio coralliirubri]
MRPSASDLRSRILFYDLVSGFELVLLNDKTKLIRTVQQVRTVCMYSATA